ncbi:Hypothetical protein, putative, partial [Bodo saltans]
MLRHCSLTRDLHSLMVGGVHRRVWTGSAPGPVKLKKAGASSAVVDNVEDLISMCEQAPFDVNGSAVTDLTVRNTLRVAADRVSVEWPAISQAVEDCAAHLGLGSGVTAQLHDVLVYRPGGLLQAPRGLDQAPASPRDADGGHGAVGGAACGWRAVFRAQIMGVVWC